MTAWAYIKDFFSFLSLKKRWHLFFSASYYFQNYFWLFTIGTAVQIVTGKGYLISIFFPAVLYYLAWNHGKGKVKKNIFDLLWIIFFLLSIYTWLFNEFAYKKELIIRFFFAQGAYMMAYWIGRNVKQNFLQSVIENAFKPLLITAIIGIYLYLVKPDWYMLFLLQQFSEIGNQAFQEFARLRSIFASPYVLAYFCSFVISYNWFKIFSSKKTGKGIYFYQVILITTSFFCMMRAPIACWMLSLGLAIFYNMKYFKGKRFLKKISPFVLIASLMLPLAISKMDTDDFSFFTDKIKSVSSSSQSANLLKERLMLYNIKESLWGEGAGRHAFYADDYPPNYQLPDNEYQKVIVEVGFFGLITLCSLWVLALLKGMFYFKHLYYETCLVITCIFTMSGASSLTIVNEHPFIFWLALGQISRFEIAKKGDYE